MEDKHVYGGVIYARLNYIKDRHGTDAFGEIMEEAKRNGYAGPTEIDDIKLARAYPIDYLVQLMKIYLDKFGEERFEDMSKEVAKKKGIVGFFVKWAASPETLLRKAAEYWPKFYDFGKMEGGVVGKNTGFVRGYGVSPDPLFCTALSSYYRGIFENIRVGTITVSHIKCEHEGDSFCEWEVLWSK